MALKVEEGDHKSRNVNDLQRLKKGKETDSQLEAPERNVAPMPQ